MNGRNLGLAVGIILAACIGPAVADTMLVSGGNLFESGGWTNGMPRAHTGGTINNGTISVNGVVSCGDAGFDFNNVTAGTVTVSHTAGDIVRANNNYPGWFDYALRNSASNGAVYNWNQSGGSVTARLVSIRDRVNYTLSGTGVLAAAGPGGDRIETLGSGTFTQTGGTVNSDPYWVRNNTTMSLSGGTGVSLGKYWHDCAFRASNSSSSQILIGGDYAASVDSAVTVANVVVLENGGLLRFDATWSGSLTRDNFTKADWITALTDTGIKVGDTQVTSDNFDTLFAVGNAGDIGSNVTLVPEPTTLALLGLGGLALLRRRKA